MPLIDHFPSELPEPRKQQREALSFLENAFKDGVSFCILEMAVGAGKSGSAMTVSRALGGGIVATPQVALQSQYLRDFNNAAPLLGRGRFPCLKRDPSAFKAIPLIQEGVIPPRPELELSCASAPCLNKPASKRERIKDECERSGGCPYQTSLDVAQKSETIISNLHALLFSVMLSDKISKRRTLIIDEAHDLPAFFRDFLKVKFKIRRKVDHRELETVKTVEQWLRWLQLPAQMDLLSNEDSRDSYVARIEKLTKIGEVVFQYWDDEKDGQLWIELTPTNVGGFARTVLTTLAEKVVVMSGTFYGKETWCRQLGLDPTTVAYLHIASDFPKENRPVVFPRIMDLDLSHKNWQRNLPTAIEELRAILARHPNHKGLIHTNSYKMSRELSEALGDPRVVAHTAETFTGDLKAFYETSEPLVFMSPTITQGVDFYGDRARFQILIRPSYSSITDPYTKWLLENNRWDIYNWNALKIFGQTLGRVVRSKEDWGVTYLLSGTFMNLIKKSNSLLPLWVKQSMVKYENFHPNR
jgi:Rad3-related DNA helicase